MPRKKTEEPFDHWQKLVELFFDFCQENFGTKPSFDGSSPRDMKSILTQIRKRTEDKNIGWTEEVALARWRAFLSFAFKDSWLKDHWTLANINRQKDALFIRAASLVTKKPSAAAKTTTELPSQDVYDYMN